MFNDITARDIQRKEMESGVFSFSKGIDTFCPIGPWIVTRDEVPDMHELPMQLRVNGEVRQQGNTNQTRIKFPHLVAYHSPQIYSAGDIITTGTISGVAAVQPNPFDFYLKPGDQIEAEITGIGTLRNKVISWEDRYGEPGSAAGRLVRLANLGGGAVLVRADEPARSTSRSAHPTAASAPDPQSLFDDWAAFAEWARAVSDARDCRVGDPSPSSRHRARRTRAAPAPGVRDRPELRRARRRGRVPAGLDAGDLHEVPVVDRRARTPWSTCPRATSTGRSSSSS